MSDRSLDSSFAARATRDRLQSFLAARLASDSDAESVVAQHLARALQWSASLPPGTSLVARWQQILRHAIVEHVRTGVTAPARDRAWQAIVAIAHAHHHPLLAGCFSPVIAELPLDQALLLHHVEILGQPLDAAARELGHPPAAAAALLLRAEASLHARLERVFDDSASPDHALPPPKEFSRHSLAQLRAGRRLADRARPSAALA